MKRYIIANPASGSNKGRKLWGRITAYIKESGVECEIMLTRKKYDATRFAYHITSTGGDEEIILIVFGGDGTLNEVINGINSFKNLKFGYIPSGSGNDFARAMNIKFDIEKSMDMLLNPNLYTEIDYGLTNFDGETRRFLISSGAGYDAHICEAVNSSGLKAVLNRLKLGKLTYLVLGVTEMIKLHPYAADLVLSSGQKLRLERMIFTSAHILPFEGGGFKFCPEADGTDGLLDVCVISGISKVKALCLIPLAKFGLHVHFNGIETYRCSRIEITSEKKICIHTDGETFPYTKKAVFESGKNKLRFILY